MLQEIKNETCGCIEKTLAVIDQEIFKLSVARLKGEEIPPADEVLYTLKQTITNKCMRGKLN